MIEPFRDTLTLSARARSDQRLIQSCIVCNTARRRHAKDLLDESNDPDATLPELEQALKCPQCNNDTTHTIHLDNATPGELIDNRQIIMIGCRLCRTRRRVHPVRLVYGHRTERNTPLFERIRATEKCRARHCKAKDHNLAIEILHPDLALILADDNDARLVREHDEVHIISVDFPHSAFTVALNAQGFEPSAERLVPGDTLYETLIGRRIDEEVLWSENERPTRWLIAWIAEAARP